MVFPVEGVFLIFHRKFKGLIIKKMQIDEKMAFILIQGIPPEI